MPNDKPRRKNAPGAGRPPVAPGGVTPVTVTLSAQDIAYLKSIDSNLSNAVRIIVKERKETER